MKRPNIFKHGSWLHRGLSRAFALGCRVWFLGYLSYYFVAHIMGPHNLVGWSWEACMGLLVAFNVVNAAERHLVGHSRLYFAQFVTISIVLLALMFAFFVASISELVYGDTTERLIWVAIAAGIAAFCWKTGLGGQVALSLWGRRRFPSYDPEKHELRSVGDQV